MKKRTGRNAAASFFFFFFFGNNFVFCIIYKNMESLFCTPKTNITLEINSTSIKKKDKSIQ